MNLRTLLGSLTIEEKAGQLAQLPPYFFNSEALIDVAGPVQRLNLSETDIFLAGSVLGVGSPKEMIDIQRTYLEKSRHKIPLMFMADIIHGYKTIFPIPLALAGSFSKENFHKMARASAKEATLSGIHVTFSPMADLVKDPRWGRVMEGFGEDPMLSYHYAYEMTKGYQGDKLTRQDSLAACIKHFAAYGAPLAGRDYAQATLSLHDFYREYDAGYRGAIDAGVRMAMTSFNVFEGIPATIHQDLLKKVLRKKMGFKGVTISDYDSIIETVVHRVSKDQQDAVRQAMLATVDIEMASGAYIKHIPSLVRAGVIELSMLDAAVLRVLKLKKDLGLFRNPFKGANVEKEKHFSLSPSQIELSKKLANESILLLKNDQNILPLSPKQRIALLGKMSATGSLLGPWSWNGNRQVTCSIKDQINPFVHEVNENITTWSQEVSQQIQQSDVIVVATGEEERESGEARSKVNPVFPELSTQFIHFLRKFNKPIVLIVTAGRPLILTPIINEVDAIVYSYYLGTSAAEAIRDTLFGFNNPSAKLTMSFPRHLGQIPIAYNHLTTGRPFLGESFTYTSHYIDESNDPLFPFGFGLSYSNFSRSQLVDVSQGQNISFEFQVQNLSLRPGYAISLLYASIHHAPFATPSKQLVGFDKVWVEANQKLTRQIDVDRQWLTYVDERYRKCPVVGDISFFLDDNKENSPIVKTFI